MSEVSDAAQVLSSEGWAGKMSRLLGRLDCHGMLDRSPPSSSARNAVVICHSENFLCFMPLSEARGVQHRRSFHIWLV